MAKTAYTKAIKPDFGSAPSLMPGINQTVFYCPLGDITTHSVPAAEPATAEEKNVIKTAHTLAAGKAWNKMYTSVEVGEVKSEPLGGTDATGFKHTVTIAVPGDSPYLNYFMNEAQGDEFIFLVPQNTNTVVQVGTEALPARLKPAYNSNTVTADSTGYSFTITAYSPFRHLYTAAIATTPASSPS